MSEQKPDTKPYKVNVYESKETPEILIFTFVPKGNGTGEPVRGKPQYAVRVQMNGAGPSLDWSCSPDDPGPAKNELEQETRHRINARMEWIRRVNDLVAKVEQWASELGWATRRIEKRLDDSWIGKHQVPALLMQEGICRILLEPVGRSGPGAEGIVDLYLLPAYDDIASLYFYGNQWNLHYPTPDVLGVPVRQVPGKPLSKETLHEALEELKQNAA